MRGFASAGLTDKLNDAHKEKLKEPLNRVENEEDDEIKYGKAFNLYIAEKRAENLVNRIRSIVGDNPKLRIYSHKWKDYQKMEKALNIVDTDEKGDYEKPRGFLTRRAEIRVLKAPACEKDI